MSVEERSKLFGPNGKNKPRIVIGIR